MNDYERMARILTISGQMTDLNELHSKTWQESEDLHRQAYKLEEESSAISRQMLSLKNELMGLIRNDDARDYSC